MTIKHQSKRWQALDIFRGLTVAVMILVNAPGSSERYACLIHSSWHGCSLADLVFPFFIWIMGVTAGWIDAPSRLNSSFKFYEHVIKRMFELMAWGLFLNIFPFQTAWGHVRVYGVLQRLALCYGVCLLALRYLTIRQQGWLVLALMASYFWLLQQPYIAHWGPFASIPGKDLGAWLDRLMWSANHLYIPTYDPEGLLSTMSSCSTVLLGAGFGQWIKRSRNSQQLVGIYLIFLILGLVGGWWLNQYQPMNKTLWNSAYVLWTMGCAVLGVGLTDVWIKWNPKPRCWVRILDVLGRHALMAYVVHVVLIKLEIGIRWISIHGEQENIRSWVMKQGLSAFSGAHASFIHACLMLCIVYGLVVFWDRKRLDFTLKSRLA